MITWLPEWFLAWAETVTITVFDVVFIITVIVSAVLFVRKGWPWLKAMIRAMGNFIQIVDSVQELPEFIKQSKDADKLAIKAFDEMSSKIDSIHHEVNFNNGSSVKDATVRIEQGLAAMGDIDTKTLRAVNTLDASMNELGAEFTAHKEWSEAYKIAQANRIKRLEKTIPQATLDKIMEEIANEEAEERLRDSSQGIRP